ncbi:MAG: primosomal protein N' [Gemmataceae bacterium]
MSPQPSLFGPTSAAPALYAEVVFDRPLDHAYTYEVPDEWKADIGVGKRVLTPFGRGDRQTIGFCVGLSPRGPEREVKSILRVLDEEPLLSEALLKLTRWMADYYLCGWGQVLNIVLPAGAKKQAGTVSVAVIEPLPAMLRPALPEDLPAKQRAVVELLQQKDEPIEVRKLSQLVGCGPSVIRAVVQRGLARRRLTRIENPDIEEEENYEAEATTTAAPSITLTADQQQVWSVLEPALREHKYQAFLLHGVTGSGKTELYLRAIEQVVRSGRQAIVLVPEISLTPQTVQAFRGRGWEVAVLHSHMHQAERGRHWRRIAAGEVQVIVGARSAVFAPARRLGLVVIDEEHESSFKQDNVPRYHARDVAIMRARMEDVPILLGSATPSLESWHNVQRGLFKLLSLPRRVFDRPMPPVHRIDLRYDRGPDRKFHGISPSLERAMKLALDQGGQIILLLNRRGFATFLHCPGCGHVELCKYCDLAVTFHQERKIVICHYCGYEGPPPERCPECQLGQVKYQGMGTEKLEAEIRAKFPGRVMERMDSDTMKKPGSHRKVLEAFRNNEIQILMGTQMIAKGLDFPNVTLVGVVNADIALHRADFRAGERTFQLLAQVAGRTGRGPRGGAVYVQTFTPEHPSIALASLHDYLTFAKGELEARRPHGYPPYQRLVRLLIRGKNQEAAFQFAEKLGAAFKPALDILQKNRPEPEQIRILGPAEAPVFRLKGLHRYHFQLQSPSSTFLHQVLKAVLPVVRVPHGVELVVDVDPQDMM